MIRKNFTTAPVIILILTAIVLSGCAGQSDSQAAQTGNINKAPTAAANNNNIPANPANTQMPPVNNASTATTAGKDNKKPAPAVKEPTPQIGSGGDDMSLFMQARGALSSDKELFNAVILEIKEGNLTLNGKVSSEAQKAKAAQLIQSVKGIKSVKNNLRVS
ncbi:MAG TPA: BON domain-containing protein [Pyrinomonadaceae bacterium]|nr:BON domain-containing protein [Pyrinomonadaceae bacterium]